MKRYVTEDYSNEVIALIRGAATRSTCVLARVEVPAAIAGAARAGNVSRAEGIQAGDLFARHWLRYGRIGVGEELLRTAAAVAWRRDLRGYDATHLAALLLRAQLRDPLQFATFDDDLWRAARAEGLDVWPPNYRD